MTKSLTVLIKMIGLVTGVFQFIGLHWGENKARVEWWLKCMVNETNRLKQVVPWKLIRRKLCNEIPPKVKVGELRAFSVEKKRNQPP